MTEEGETIPQGELIDWLREVVPDAMAAKEQGAIDDFSNHPVSLAEVRSEKSENAKDWTPRDALVWLLRKIDSGEAAPTTVVIMYGEQAADGLAKSSYVIASPTVLETFGVVSHETWKMHHHTEAD